ncbi:MAG: ParB family transcriptional regulator, chromosome partitioning protein [Clostridia bacterium]|nr:ParB family transcriptional regulator, chromosome partitioning protein [Clostridia bacterium]
MVKRGLGRGLGALLPAGEEEGVIRELDLESIISSGYQPRESFDDEKLEELAASIREHGVIQPIIVQPLGDDKFRIVAGERRWRACRKAGLKKIPAIVRELNERQMAEIALVENLQREDLNPLEEARAYARLLEEFGLTQEEVARRVGKSRPVISNALRLLQLPLEVQQLLCEGKITTGHARALLGISEASEVKRLAQRIVGENLSVRETEKLVRNWVRGEKKGPRGPGKVFIDGEMEDIIARLQDKFGTRVCLRQKKSGGRIEFYFYSSEDLYRLIEEFLNISAGI